MSTPSTQDEPAEEQASTRETTKSIRVPPEIHARLQGLAGGLNGTMADAIAWLLSPSMVRVTLPLEQRERWDAAAKESGMRTSEFVVARVEAALHFGADHGAVRRIHDMTYALCRAAGINPRQLSAPGADRQVIHVDPRRSA
jgi:predicted DNA-binding protein